MTSSIADDLLWKGHVRKIVEAILAGRIVPFLGADINLCDRPKTQDGKDAEWTSDAPFPPSNQELAVYLDAISSGLGPAYHHELSCPFVENKGLEQLPEECPLRRGGTFLRLPVQNVSQYVVASGKAGDEALDEALSNLFAKPYEPNALHRFLASLPALLRGMRKGPNYPLIVTTCFDSALERAFEEAGESIDLVYFIGDAQGGRFQHLAPDGSVYEIEVPNSYSDLDLGKRPVILKLYGGYSSGSFQITEDHYIDYLSHRGIANLIPSYLLKILRADDTSLWFLGYSLSLWNQRVILRRLWQEKIKESGKPWWAIQGHPDPLDLRMWERYLVRVLQPPDLRLEKYIAAIDERLRAAPMLAPVISPSSGGSTPRDGVFFSYSHDDKKWLEQIKKILAPVTRSGQLSEWDDTQIQPGSKWREAIKGALASAKVAVLLVSPAFLASEFIAGEELPALLEAAQKEGLVILWVLLENCLYQYTALKDYQAVLNPSKPLSGLAATKRSEALSKIAQSIIDSLKRT